MENYEVQRKHMTFDMMSKWAVSAKKDNLQKFSIHEVSTDRGAP